MENNKTIKIKKCPFCDSQFVTVLDFENATNNTMYYASCSVCHASGSETLLKNDAIKIWNSIYRRKN